jgi:hypothetical protein
MTKHQQKQLQHRFERKYKLCLSLSIGLVVIMALVKMIFYNRAATWGRTLEAIKQETAQVRHDNQRLKSELARRGGGLNQLAQQAKELGFIENPTIKYFTSGVSVAQKLP